MADGVIATDEQGKITMYNGAALNILDKNSALDSSYIGNALKLIGENDQPIDSTRLIVGTKIQTISRDYKMRYSDGSLVNIYLSIAPVKPGYGSVSKGGFVILVRDITKEKSLEDERDEFISVVSHELRTPVTIAEGNLSNAQIMLKRGMDEAKLQDTIVQAHDQILFLASLINDLSTLSRAEHGTLDVDYVSINVPQLIQKLSDNYTTSVEKKGLKLYTEVDPGLEVLRSSSLYVREILQNFITNAIKYTEEGHITIAAKATNNGVKFVISDTGIGISKNDQEHVFGKFFRSEDFRTRKNNGTGLGLYVTMKLAKMINATVSLESSLNQGSIFTITVPNMELGERSSTTDPKPEQAMPKL